MLEARKGPIPLVYKFGNRVLAWMTLFLYGVRLRDPLTGMYVARSVLRRAKGSSSGFDAEAEIIARVMERGGAVVEVPTRFRERLGRKKLRPWHGFLISWRAV